MADLVISHEDGSDGEGGTAEAFDFCSSLKEAT